MNPFAVCGFALAALGAMGIIKHASPQMSSVAVAICGAVIFVYVLQGITPVISYVRGITQENGVQDYFLIMLKALAISLCCRFCAELCRDCGEATLASRIELAGKASIVALSLPLIQQLLTLAKDMLG